MLLASLGPPWPWQDRGMRKTLTITYPAAPNRVAAMLADPEYQRGRLERVRLRDADVDVAQRGRGFVVTVTGSVPAQMLPAATARFIRSAVSFTLLESWGEPAADGARSGSIDTTVKGAPVSASARTTMSPASQGSTAVVLDLDVKVSVPLVGRSIEEKALAQVGRIVADEERRGAAWLAAHPA